VRRATLGAARRASDARTDEPLWYKDAVFYELSVRAFCDADGDGVGDFRGLRSRLDYVRDLGARALWLQPFYPSPLKDDGYDVTDFTSVHPDHGSLGDFRAFLDEAHARGLRVVIEMAFNHTSDQHPWFRRARRAPAGSRERAFYVWSPDPGSFAEARVLMKDVETSNWAWDPVAGAYYWHRFYAHEPDLNFANPAVRRQMLKAVDFWLAQGVDGLRLDAVPFLFEREGTPCENLPETHELLQAVRRHVDTAFPGRVLVTEANQWPEEAAAYFGGGEGCQLVAHTPLMPRLFTALHLEDRHPVVDILRQTPTIPKAAQWMLFLRNHDELTLQMVTDEERDTMYRAYAPDPRARVHEGIRRRLAPLLGNDRRRIELLYLLLFSLPGSPVLYYGDEIGMGDNIYLGDREGVRTPMQWSAGPNAGFSTASPPRVQPPPVADTEFSFSAVNVAAQLENPQSLLWWMRRTLAVRRRHRAFGRGSLVFLEPANRRVLAFVRAAAAERILVVASLSRHLQHVELDLSAFAGARLVDLFGQTELPAIGAHPYPLTLAPHAVYWLAVEDRAEGSPRDAEPEAGHPPRLDVAGSWEQLLAGDARDELAAALPRFLRGRRWFAGKAERIRSVEIVDAAALPGGQGSAWLALARVAFARGEPQVYALPLAAAFEADAWPVRMEQPGSILADVVSREGAGILYAAERRSGFARVLLDAVARQRRFAARDGEIVGVGTRAFRGRRSADLATLEASLLSAEQSNTSVRFGDRFILKLFRKIENGPNPDLEIGTFLTERTGFSQIAPVCGWLEYRPRRGSAAALAILLGYVPNRGDAWEHTLDAVGRYLDRLLVHTAGGQTPSVARAGLLERAREPVPPLVRELAGSYLDVAALLGRRTAELHLALASESEDAAFAPEPFSRTDQRSLHQSCCNLTEEALGLLRRKLDQLPPEARGSAHEVLSRREELLRRFRPLLERRLTALRTRTHGDYHLGQVLWTGRDFVIIDFEGEPARPLAIRRAKRSPLRDVAGMMRSFHYAARQGLASHLARGVVPAEREAAVRAWAERWHDWASTAFLGAYLEAASGAAFLPTDTAELRDLLVVHLLEKAVYELSYELNNRPAWVSLPLAGIVGLLGRAEPGTETKGDGT
jgi:maltose alpha-D-glucosyltransferase/alpha-amylase